MADNIGNLAVQPDANAAVVVGRQAELLALVKVTRHGPQSPHAFPPLLRGSPEAYFAEADFHRQQQALNALGNLKGSKTEG